ncbi:MAG: hypothetical protein MI892_27715, partial [Desulfobacterales bacterium]|nr:hypothetical protein [Desulfobacterales bacterium]
ISGGYPPTENSDYVTIIPGTESLKYLEDSPLEITMNLSNTRQKIKNFGASDCWSVQFVGNWPEEKVNYMADLLFSSKLHPDGSPKGIGLTGWRVNLGAGSSRKSPRTIYDQWRRADFYYNSSLTGYDWTRCSGQRNFMQLAKERGLDQFTAFSNSPPYTMTKNGYAFCDPSVGSTNLDPAKHQDFATYLADVLEHFRDVEGIEFENISPLNEPEWDWNEKSSDPGHAYQEGCRYSNTDIAQFTRVLHNELSSRNIHTEIELCDSGQIDYLYSKGGYKGNHIYEFFDTGSSDFIGNSIGNAISSHSYWTDTVENIVTKRQSLRAKLDQYGLNYSETEYCILGNRDNEIDGNGRDLGIHPALWAARTIHNDLVVAQAQIWQWWLGISPYNYKDGLVYC